MRDGDAHTRHVYAYVPHASQRCMSHEARLRDAGSHSRSRSQSTPDSRGLFSRPRMMTMTLTPNMVPSSLARRASLHDHVDCSAHMLSPQHQNSILSYVQHIVGVPSSAFPSPPAMHASVHFSSLAPPFVSARRAQPRETRLQGAGHERTRPAHRPWRPTRVQTIGKRP